MASALMQWFSFTCPSCALTLQAKLPEGITSVQCSGCKSVFAVQIQPTVAGPSGPAGQHKKGARKRSKIDKEGNTAPRVLNAYNVFMKEELAKVKREHPELIHKDAFKMVRCSHPCTPTEICSLCISRQLPPATYRVTISYYCSNRPPFRRRLPTAGRHHQ